MFLDSIKKTIEKIDNKNFINICAYELSAENWQDLILFLNNTHKIVFKEYLSNKETEKIDLESLLNFWNGTSGNGYMAIINLENIQINCYFNSINDLDFDIIYDDIFKNGNLQKIIYFISSMSEIIDKPFYLEEDSYSIENKLLKIYKNEVLLLESNN